jgi:hypothetical protein
VALPSWAEVGRACLASGGAPTYGRGRGGRGRTIWIVRVEVCCQFSTLLKRKMLGNLRGIAPFDPTGHAGAGAHARRLAQSSTFSILSLSYLLLSAFPATEQSQRLSPPSAAMPLSAMLFLSAPPPRVSAIVPQTETRQGPRQYRRAAVEDRDTAREGATHLRAHHRSFEVPAVVRSGRHRERWRGWRPILLLPCYNRPTFLHFLLCEYAL